MTEQLLGPLPRNCDGGELSSPREYVAGLVCISLAFHASLIGPARFPNLTVFAFEPPAAPPVRGLFTRPFAGEPPLLAALRRCSACITHARLLKLEPSAVWCSNKHPAAGKHCSIESCCCILALLCGGEVVSQSCYSE